MIEAFNAAGEAVASGAELSPSMRERPRSSGLAPERAFRVMYTAPSTPSSPRRPTSTLARSTSGWPRISRASTQPDIERELPTVDDNLPAGSVTFLCTDVEGSTRGMGALGRADATTRPPARRRGRRSRGRREQHLHPRETGRLETIGCRTEGTLRRHVEFAVHRERTRGVAL